MGSKGYSSRDQRHCSSRVGAGIHGEADEGGARQAFPVIETVKILEKKLSHIKTPITLSIIGCVVNGPGEAAQTEIGLTGGGQDNNLLYLSGIPHEKVASGSIIDKVVELVENKVKEKVN